MNYELFLAIGNILFSCAAIPNITAVFKDRNKLHGFSIYGAILNFVGMGSVLIALFLIDSPLNVVLSLPTFTFWGIVVCFKLMNRAKNVK